MKVLENLQNILRFKNYSERTIETYVCYLGKFLEEENIKDPYQVTTKQIESYLFNRTYSSVSQQNQIIDVLNDINLVSLKERNRQYYEYLTASIIHFKAS